MAPRFSVIVPLFNKRAYFARTLESVLSQTFSDFEIIIADDGSTDGSAELVAPYSSSRIKVVRQANAGPGPARNTAARHANGEWLALLDADDLWASDHLATLDRIIGRYPDVGLIATKTLWTSDGQLRLETAMPRGGTIRRLDYFVERGEEWVTASSVALRHDAFWEIGGFGDFCPGEDMELCARLALQVPFAISEDVTAIYLRGNDGIMERAERDERSSCDRHITPLETTLLRALADPRYVAHHVGIREYLDRLKLRDARICIYRGDHRQARAQLAAMSRRRSPRSWAYRVLASAPPSLVDWGLRLYSRAKRVMTSPRSMNVIASSPDVRR